MAVLTIGTMAFEILVRQFKGLRCPSMKRSVSSQNHTNQDDLATSYFDRFDSYCKMVANAKATARRSVLIDHCGTKYIDLKDIMRNIDQAYVIEQETSVKSTNRFSLLEFGSEHDAERVVKKSKHICGAIPMPLKIIRYSGRNCEIPCPMDERISLKHISMPYSRELNPEVYSYKELIDNNVMSTMALKLRFITLVNLEQSLCSGLFSEYELMPFGSSVTDIGSNMADLDIVMTRKRDHEQALADIRDDPAGAQVNDSHLSNFMHLDKRLYLDSRDRTGVKGFMKFVDYTLKEFWPLTHGQRVLPLFRASVPIIKFTSSVTNVDCDLSFDLGVDVEEKNLLSTNYSGIYMSQVLYSLYRKNVIFKGLVVYMRTLFKLKTITTKDPSTGLTNFQLLSLLIFYLQRVTITNDTAPKVESLSNQRRSHSARAILPKFSELMDAPSYQPDESVMTPILNELIIGFLKFYSTFNFNFNAINLNESRIERKRDNSPMFILNPLSQDKNVCRSVTYKTLAHFITKVRESVRDIEQQMRGDPLAFIRLLLVEEQKRRSNQKPDQFLDSLMSQSEDFTHGLCR